MCGCMYININVLIIKLVEGLKNGSIQNVDHLFKTIKIHKEAKP